MSRVALDDEIALLLRPGARSFGTTLRTSSVLLADGPCHAMSVEDVTAHYAGPQTDACRHISSSASERGLGSGPASGLASASAELVYAADSTPETPYAALPVEVLPPPSQTTFIQHHILAQSPAGSKRASFGTFADEQQQTAEDHQSLHTANELLQAEVAEWQSRHASLAAEAAEMQSLLAEYERTMAAMIAARAAQPGQAPQSPDAAHAVAATHIAYANMRQRYEETRAAAEQLRAHDTVLRTTLGQLQAELAAADRRFEDLRAHAEERISTANDDVHRLRTTLEIDLSTTKAKLRQAELRIAGLESQVEAKARENGELMAICDELIAKIDALGGSASANA